MTKAANRSVRLFEFFWKKVYLLTPVTLNRAIIESLKICTIEKIGCWLSAHIASSFLPFYNEQVYNIQNHFNYVKVRSPSTVFSGRRSTPGD